MHYTDALFAQSRTPAFAGSDSLQRRIDRAHRRLLAAAKALASIRRLALPVVLAQVSVTAAPAQLEPGQTRYLPSNTAGVDDCRSGRQRCVPRARRTADFRRYAQQK